ncbi:MAG: cystathionine gamma-synthase [Actinomycetota bacterium]|jgi:cystathionine beta-lyase/cystathionine gamma-synthase|nr:cystathionine gamma-synthase [Actinomycetota bacterium]
MSDGMRFETTAIHAGQEPDSLTGSIVVPLYQTSTYVQDEVGKPRGYEYSRTDNPTRNALEVCLAGLEGASHAVTFGSGMAALTTIVMTLKSGDRVLIPDDVYGGTYRLFSKVMVDFGISYDTVDMTDEDAVAKGLEAGARLVVAETPTNPTLKVLDLEMLSGLAHEAGAFVVVDNTFATPFLQLPLELGADAVVYSATKYLGGHSDLVMGSVATSDEALAERLRFVRNALGPIPSPFDCWLLLRGLKTLALRMRAHCANAATVAQFLSAHEGVSRVYFPGLPHAAGHEIATRQMSAAGEPLYGGMVSFEVDSEKQAVAACAKTKLFFLGESLGGVESLIEHPARMTHFSLAGSPIEVPGNLIRLSVGIEHPDDLVADLEVALS